MKRNDKLDKLRQSRLRPQKELIQAHKDFISEFSSKIDELKEVLGVPLDVNIEPLLEQLKTIESISPSVEKLQQSISKLNFPTAVKVKGLEDMLKELRKETKLSVDIDTDGIISALAEIRDKISERVIIQNRSPDEFIPFRRVVSIGNRLVFDDNIGGNSGGGGGIQSGLIFNQSLRITDAYLEFVSGMNSSTDTTDTTVIAGVAGRTLFITDIILSNSSATDTEVMIKDTSGNRLLYPAPQKAGAVHSTSKPLKLAEGSGLIFASLASVTTMKVSALGYII